MWQKFRQFIGVWVAIVMLAGPMAYAQQLDLIRDLKSEWQIYDNQKGVYLPYLPSYHGQTSQLHLLLDVQALTPYYLNITAQGATHLFVNNQLWYTASKNMPVAAIDVTIPIQELTALDKDSTGQLMLSLYANDGQAIIHQQTYISKYSVQTNIAKGRHTDWEPQEKPSFTYQSTLTFLGIALMAIFAVFYRAPTPIFNMNYLSRYLSGFTKIKNDGSRINIVSILLFSIFYALSFTYLLTLIQSFDIAENRYQQVVSWEMLQVFGRIFLWFAIFLVVKLVLISFAGMLYDNRKIFNIHVQEFMNINQMLGLGIMASAGILHFSNQLTVSSTREIVFVTACISMIISGFLIAYRINKTLPFKKVYLFSYLCGTEFFPVLVLIKFLIEQQAHFFST